MIPEAATRKLKKTKKETLGVLSVLGVIISALSAVLYKVLMEAESVFDLVKAVLIVTFIIIIVLLFWYMEQQHKVPRGLSHQEKLKIYEKTVRTAGKDGEFSDDEQEMIREQKADLEITTKEHNTIIRKMRDEKVEFAGFKVEKKKKKLKKKPIKVIRIMKKVKK